MILITNAARLSRASPHRFSLDTAEIFSPRKSTVSPAYSGRSLPVICITNADIIIPINSSMLIVIGLARLVTNCFFNFNVNASASE